MHDSSEVMSKLRYQGFDLGQDSQSMCTGGQADVSILAKEMAM